MSQSKSFLSIAATILVLAAATAYVAVMQFHYGVAPLYSYDEAWHLYLATIGPAWKMFLAASGDSHPPGYYLIMRPFFKLGQDPLYARLPTMLATIVSVPLFFAVLRKIRVRVPVSLSIVVVLALSFPFLHLGVTARQYSVTILLLMAAFWFWVNLIPGSRGRPSRGSAILSLALFSLAFSTLYAAVLVTAALFGATLLVMAVNRDARDAIGSLWRRYSGWPEWLLFVLTHLLVIGWYVVGWAKHIDFNIPSHVANYALRPGEAAVDFVHRGLRQELELFSPLSGFNGTVLDAALAAILIAMVWLTGLNLRRGNLVRAVFAFSPLVLTAILALVGLLGKYPFGGGLRHQYILFPMLLVLLALGVDALWRRFDHFLPRALLLTTMIGIAAFSSMQTLDKAGKLGEAPDTVAWPDAYHEMFKSTRDEPLLIPAYAIYLTYAHRYTHGFFYRDAYQNDGHRYHIAYQGWLAIAMLWASYEEFGAIADDGSTLTVVKDQYRWTYPPVPDALFFEQTRGLLEAMGKDRIRVFGLLTNPKDKPDPEGLKAAAEQHGFTLSEYLPIEHGAIWTITMNTAVDPTGQSAAEPAGTSPTASPTSSSHAEAVQPVPAR